MSNSVLKMNWVLGVSALVLAVGCSSNDGGRKHVAGEVKFAGEPVVFGTIEFFPDKSKGHSGPAEYVDVINGVYDTRKTGGGMVFGPHVAHFSVYDGPFPDDVMEEAVAEGVVRKTTKQKMPKTICLAFPLDVDLNSSTQNFDLPESARGRKPTR